MVTINVVDAVAISKSLGVTLFGRLSDNLVELYFVLITLEAVGGFQRIQVIEYQLLARVWFEVLYLV